MEEYIQFRTSDGLSKVRVFLMSLGICPVAGSAKRMRSQTTRSAGLSDANATIDFLFSVQEERKESRCERSPMPP